MERPRTPADRPLIRRDADGKERTARSWESLTERLIREAQESGEFDDLPDHGRPLRLDDDALAGEMAMAHHVLRNAGAAPPWIEIDKQVRRELERIEALFTRAGHSQPSAEDRLRRELDALIDAHDRAARSLDTLAPTPRQQRRPLDRAGLHRRLRKCLQGER